MSHSIGFIIFFLHLYPAIRTAPKCGTSSHQFERCSRIYFNSRCIRLETITFPPWTYITSPAIQGGIGRMELELCPPNELLRAAINQLANCRVSSTGFSFIQSAFYCCVGLLQMKSVARELCLARPKVQQLSIEPPNQHHKYPIRSFTNEIRDF